MADQSYPDHGSARDHDRDYDRDRSGRGSMMFGGDDDYRPRGGRDDDRGFFERAGEEIRSWFRDEDEDDDDRGRPRSSWDRQRESGWGDRAPQGWGSRTPEDERYSGRHRGESHDDRGEWMGGRERWQSEQQGMSHYGREHGRGGFQGDYGRSGRDQGGFGGRGDWEGGRQSMSASHSRDRSRQSDDSGTYTGVAGSMGGFGNQEMARPVDQGFGGGFGETRDWDRDRQGSGGGRGRRFGSSQDDHYLSWRDRQIAELDRDYQDYCRDCEQRFHQDFDSWRQQRRGQSGSSGGSGEGEGFMMGQGSMGSDSGPGSEAKSGGGSGGMSEGSGGPDLSSTGSAQAAQTLRPGAPSGTSTLGATANAIGDGTDVGTSPTSGRGSRSKG